MTRLVALQLKVVGSNPDSPAIIRLTEAQLTFDEVSSIALEKMKFLKMKLKPASLPFHSFAKSKKLKARKFFIKVKNQF